MSVIGATAPLPDKLSRPVDGDPALGWQGSDSMETAMAIEFSVPAARRDPWNKGRLTRAKAPAEVAVWEGEWRLP
jgi:hypothetical protein